LEGENEVLHRLSPTYATVIMCINIWYK